MTGRIRKVEVATGISWVEIPEADLRVLCGCPADAVKHLMRRGLVVPAERQGVPFETGPNTVLLSDVMLQNGSFCNLAEFPVLQMLYRQGMMLPDHPNNTGAKPRLIGRLEQITAQLHYIYRGNYGLVSPEEMIAAGATPDEAAEWMRLKLRFAFGRIRNPRDLVDVVALDDAPVDLAPQATLRRLALNVFEFRCGDEAVVVDLNLPPGTSYGSPFPLGGHMVRRDYFAVLHTGDGDGWDPDRPSMGSIVLFQGRTYLVDAGASLPHQLTALGIGINEIDGLVLTHAHDDHFAGITTLLKADHRIKVFATRPVWSSAAKKLAALLAAEETDFRHYFDVHPLTAGRWNDIEGLEVKPVLSPHPVETTAMLFRALWAGGYRTYAHMADIVSLDVLAAMIEPDPARPGISRAFYERVEEDYAVPADVKKLDIGGGLIHGRARDFRTDPSKKLILAHTARALTAEEKAIGSGAPFGTVDVLIQGQQDFTWRNGHLWLHAYFPGVPAHELRLLLNSPLATFNPESILLREGAAVTAVHLILTGTIETIRGGSPSGLLSAGAMVGEVALMGGDGKTSPTTYRAVGFVNSIAIPADLYLAFAERNGLVEDIRALQERRAFLRSTWLCSDAISNVVLHGLARQMSLVAVAAGTVIAAEGRVMVIRSGRVERRLGAEVVEELGPGRAFGEETLFDAPPLGQAVAAEPTEFYAIPAQKLGEIPVIRWKLLEQFDRHLNQAVTRSDGAGGGLIVWREDYTIDIGRIDAHHRTLFDRTNYVLANCRDGGWAAAIKALDFLIGYARFHFAEEEALMAEYGYQDLPAHRAHHHRLLEQIQDIRRRLRQAEGGVAEAETLLRHWIVDHTLAEDRKFAAHLNARGVF